MSTQYLDLVPKDPLANLEWRVKLCEAALHDHGLRAAVKQAAFQDVLFWFNALCWCYNPDSFIRVKPFVTWPHQDPAILTLDKSIDDAADAEDPVDVTVDKSRKQGATWMYLLVLLRRWLRDDLFSAGLVTRNEKLVDSERDPDTLMWKVVWSLHRLPFWMWPEGFDIKKHRNLTDHILYNPQRESTIVGYAATGDVGRGGRKVVFALDELAAFKPGEDYAAISSTQHAARCRWLVSTFEGDTGAYYDAVKQEGNAIRIVLDWHENPSENKNLYRVVNGTIFPVSGHRFPPDEVERLKRQHEKLRMRGFKVEGVLRNAWYNSQCLRPSATPRSIAQELDRNPHGAASKYFSPDVMDKAKALCQPPIVRGRFVFDLASATPMSPYVVESEIGELSLWIRPGIDGSIPFGSYTIGVDISGGTGGAYTSNSVASILNKLTGEQVGEWVSNTTEPRKLGFVCVALCRWFHNAVLIPESNFRGAFFQAVMDEIQYSNLYMQESKREGDHKQTKDPGFRMHDNNTKDTVFSLMQAAIADGEYTPRSAAMIAECNEFEWKGDKIIHVGAEKSDVGGASKAAHGDRVIAAVLAWFEAHTTSSPGTPDVVPEDQIPVGCMAYRLREHDRRNGEDGDPWLNPRLDLFGKSGSDGKAVRDTWA